MKKRALAIILLMTFLCSAFALAQVVTPSTFFVTVEYVSDKIPNPDKDSADVYIVVKNSGKETDTFKLVYLEDPKWSYQALPSPLDKEVTLAPGEEGKIHLLVKGNVNPGLYGVKVSMRSENTGNVISNVMRIRVGDSSPELSPNPDFSVDVSVPAQMDPRGTYNVIVNIHNKNKRLLEDVEIKLDSKILSEDTTVTVNPDESKSVSFAVLLMDNIQPQADQLQVTVNYDDTEFYSQTHNFEVVEFVEPFIKAIDVKKSFLKQERFINIKNVGNTLKEDTVMLETSLKERFFSSSKPKFNAVEQDGKYYFAWDMSLEPEQSADIYLKTSYRWLLLIAIIIIGFIAYKAATSNPVIVKKKIMSMKRHGGAVSDFSVVILLKNRSKEPVSKIRVVERVTKMVHLKNDSFVGSVHPVKMHTHDREGALLEYRFGELAPGDERLIKYKVHSNLHIFGTITIKPTVVEFVKRNGAMKKSRSNTISLNTEEVTEAPKPKHHSNPDHKHRK